jgi:hypothetical protein
MLGAAAPGRGTCLPPHNRATATIVHRRARTPDGGAGRAATIVGMKHADHAIAMAHEMGLIVNFNARGRRTDSEALARGVARGTHLRLTPGVFVETAHWQTFASEVQFRLRFVAIAATITPDSVFSHLTAANLWGLPVLGSMPAVGVVRTYAGTGLLSRGPR